MNCLARGDRGAVEVGRVGKKVRTADVEVSKAEMQRAHLVEPTPYVEGADGTCAPKWASSSLT
jgi:hypothetical protein